MASMLGNLTRYVLVRHEGGLVEGIDIFVRGSSEVTVYSDGETFDGDLLALEALAKIHGAVAYPVEPPPEFQLHGIQKEIILPPGLEVDEPVTDWSEDHEDSTRVGPEVHRNDNGTHDVHVYELSWEEAEASVKAAPASRDLPPAKGRGAVPSSPPSSYEDDGGGTSTNLFIQGNRGRAGPVEAGTNPYDDDPGPGLGDAVLNLESLEKPPDWYGRVAVRPDIPAKPMFLSRDLGNCLYGMPRWVGTTIVGQLRPDTGGLDPVLHDHDKWMEYSACDTTVK